MSGEDRSAEALRWLEFARRDLRIVAALHATDSTLFRGSYPMAVKVAAGKVDALTGEPWTNELSRRPQDYLVVPGQPWLDGFCVEQGLIRQFVAMPLGAGYSAEEQLTGEARHGGLQIAVYPMEGSSYEAMTEAYVEEPLYAAMPAPEPELGLAPGGLMRQEVYEDLHGFDAWDTAVRTRCFVHILNSVQFLGVTGGEPPHEPVSAQDYSAAGLPWFEYYGADLEALAGATKLASLASLDSVAARSLKLGAGVVPDNEPVTPLIVGLSARPVREGEF